MAFFGCGWGQFASSWLYIGGIPVPVVDASHFRPQRVVKCVVDPLERGGSVSLAYGDLLPIQQLAQMDDDLLRSSTSSLPTRLAAKLWRSRVDPTVGDNPWREGCKDVREYVKAGDMKHWIRRQERGINDSYAKKLVSRTIDALLELSKHRIAIRKKTERTTVHRTESHAEDGRLDPR